MEAVLAKLSVLNPWLYGAALTVLFGASVLAWTRTRSCVFVILALACAVPILSAATSRIYIDYQFRQLAAGPTQQLPQRVYMIRFLIWEASKSLHFLLLFLAAIMYFIRPVRPKKAAAD